MGAMRSLRIILSACSLLLLSHPLSAKAQEDYLNTHSVLLDGNEIQHLEDAFKSHLQPAIVTRRNEWTSTIPEHCLREALLPRPDTEAHPNPNQTPKCLPENLKVVEFWFTDAPRSWITCRCTDTEYTEQQMVEVLAKLPVGMRQYITYFVALRNTWLPGLVGFVRMENYAVTLYEPKLSGLVHEIGHIIDKHLGMISRSPEFKAAVDADSCFFSAHGRNTASAGGDNRYIEALAEAFRFHRWQRHAERGIGHDVSCTKNQLDFVAERMDSQIPNSFDKNLVIPAFGPGIHRSKAMDVVPYNFPTAYRHRRTRRGGEVDWSQVWRVLTLAQKWPFAQKLGDECPVYEMLEEEDEHGHEH